MTRRSLPVVRVASPKVVFATLLSAFIAAGCIDPKADYQDFASRPLSEREAGLVDVQHTPCQELIEQDPSGRYYLSCRPMALPTPFGLAITQTLTAPSGGGVADFVLSFTPLMFGAANFPQSAGDTTTL